jgi:signal recognition particle 43 kDa protein
MTWEPTANLSEDLVRDFEEAFWQSCKMGDIVFLNEALKWGGETMANLLNSEGRGPLHLTAALNHQNVVKTLLEHGVQPLPDHIAVQAHNIPPVQPCTGSMCTME